MIEIAEPPASTSIVALQHGKRPHLRFHGGTLLFDPEIEQPTSVASTLDPLDELTS